MKRKERQEKKIRGRKRKEEDGDVGRIEELRKMEIEKRQPSRVPLRARGRSA